MGLYVKGITKEDLLKILPVLESAIIEVPEPHGRLIDADYVLSKLYKREPEFTEEIEWIQACIALLNHAPTVIEA